MGAAARRSPAAENGRGGKASDSSSSDDKKSPPPPSPQDPPYAAQASLSGLYLFAMELLVIALVFSKALHRNAGRKFVRVKQDGCHHAWAAMDGDHSSIACCSLTDPHDPARWDAAICAASTSAATAHLTSGLALVLPFATLILNALFSWRQPREVQVGQRRRFGLYAFVIAFRTAVLLILLNRIQAHVQSEEGDSCWYSPLRHDGRCRERFDFADHGVLFISQYLAIQTFECVAVLREATSLVHLLACLATACLISTASLLGFYATVSFFHTRLESAVALALSVVTVQLPLFLIISGRLRRYKWGRLAHYVRR